MDVDLKAAAEEFLVRYGGDYFEELFSRASGSLVYDANGREILDFTSGQMCATIGHNHPEIIKAIHTAGETALHMFSGMVPTVVAELGQMLAENWLPAPLRKSLFVNTGSESNEAALRMSKMYTGGYEVLAIGGSWHGVTGASAAASFASDRKGYGPTLPGLYMIPEPNSYRPLLTGASADDNAMTCLDLGLQMFDVQSRGAPAAVIVEPVISAGGVIVPPQCFMDGLRTAADERGMLLIFDEAQTAFGRIGEPFGATYFDVVPDIMSVSKTLGGGLPLAATITTPDIEQAVHEKGFTFYTSHVSDPLPAHAGLAVLRTIVQENLVERAAEMGNYLHKQLDDLQQRHEVIGDIRGLGLLIGIELVEDRHSKVPHHRLGAATTDRCFELGLSMNIRRRPERGAVWRIAPPLTVEHAEIDRAIAILDQALTESLDRPD